MIVIPPAPWDKFLEKTRTFRLRLSHPPGWGEQETARNVAEGKCYILPSESRLKLDSVKPLSIDEISVIHLALPFLLEKSGQTLTVLAATFWLGRIQIPPKFHRARCPISKLLERDLATLGNN